MSNTRFVDKGKLKADVKSLEAIMKFYENGGTISVFPTRKQPKRKYTLGTAKKRK